METVFISDFNNALFTSCFQRALIEFSVDTNQLDKFINDFNAAGNIYAYILVDEQGESIGLIQFQKTELSNDYIKEEYGLIREFWIAPEYRKKGLGAYLLKEVEYYFIKSDIRFIILSSRQESIGFYIKNGYAEKKNAHSFNKMMVMEKEL